MRDIVVVGTWPFSKKPVTDAGRILSTGDTCCEDALTRSINAAEQDPLYGKHLVGRGGARNAAGQLELDAALMSGRTLGFGAVLAMQGVTNAISVASDVMRHSEHSMLAGDGAQVFAQQRGYTADKELLVPLQEAPMKHTDTSSGKDTLGLIALYKGDVCAGVTTSGKAGKHPGRVGDSPLPGSGLYADNEGGAACCTGDGDEILKFCPSFHAVLLMKQGNSPQEACDHVIADVIRRLGSRDLFEFGMIALDMKGEVGAAGTVTSYSSPESGKVYEGFPYTLYRGGDSEAQIRVQKATVKPI